MEDPVPYRWTFDRSSWDGSRLAETFSVGVYQWIPAASGKLKRSRTIRVQGYTAEPDRVYAQARELCDRLNADGIRAECPPAWLRKQYSVPRPAAAPPPPPPAALTGGRVRAIRLRAMERSLVPEGFRKGKGSTYVRVRNEQVHVIDFQANKHGGEFTVNLGFHYTFVPPYSRGAAESPESWGLLDCALSARLGHFLPNRADSWLAYGADPDRLQALFEETARAALSVLDRWSAAWTDLAWWLEPDRMRGLLQDRLPWVDAWHLRRPELFLGAAALRQGRTETGRELLSGQLHAESAAVRRAAAALLETQG